MMQDVNILEEIFYSTEVWGYFGPLILILATYLISKKSKPIGVLWYVVMMFIGVDYLLKITETGYYAFHAVLVFFGGFIAVIAPLLEN